MKTEKKRLMRLAKKLRENKADALILSGFESTDENIPYFCGVAIDYSFLIVTKKGNSIVLCPKMEYERAKKLAYADSVLMFEKPVFEQIAKILGKYRVKNATTNFSSMTVRCYKELKKAFRKRKLRLADFSRELYELRAVKDSDEIKSIVSACKIADSCFSKLIRKLRAGKIKTEEEAALFLKAEIQKNNAEPSFEPIVASGKHSGMPHYRYSKAKFKRGFCVIDFGAKVNGYCSDITRTIFFGEPTEREKGLYDVLLEVQKRCIEKAKSGTEAKEIYSFAKQKLGVLSEKFTHGLGHGIGLKIHELPSLVEESKDVISEGMAFTIEPGIYFEGGFGIRIEDDIVIRNKKPAVLTKSTKKLIVIGDDR